METGELKGILFNTLEDRSGDEYRKIPWKSYTKNGSFSFEQKTKDSNKIEIVNLLKINFIF